MATFDLAGRRVMVVEDQYILGLDICYQVEEHDGVVICPFVTLAQGISAVQEHRPDACILNIRLGPNMVYELADQLLDATIPSSLPVPSCAQRSLTDLRECRFTPNQSPWWKQRLR